MDDIERSIGVVGEDDPCTDWELRPEEHVARLAARDGAGPLIRILQRPEVSEIMERYAKSNARAVACQRRFVRWSRIEIAATFAATALGALAFLSVHQSNAFTVIQVIIIGAQYALLALAIGAAYWLLLRRFLIEWQSARADAENARGALFDVVMALDEPQRNGELPCLALKLEYFRRYHLDVQLRYYAGRADQSAWGVRFSDHLRRASAAIFVLTLTLGLSFMLALAYVSGLRMLGEDIVLTLEQTLLSVGIIASASHAMASALPRVTMDERNARRFAVTADNLQFLREKGLGPARAHAKEGDFASVLHFVSDVQQQVSVEHREWVLLRGSH